MGRGWMGYGWMDGIGGWGMDVCIGRLVDEWIMDWWCVDGWMNV